jgi:quercetin dioxygenase-like cupin family protein
MRFKARVLGLVAILLVTELVTAAQALREEPLCIPDSPERRGGIGCSIVEIKQLPSLTQPVFWHIDRFDSGEQARAAIDPFTIAFQAHGTWWTMSVESEGNNHHGGEHVARVKLSPLPDAEKYSMLVISATIPAGMTSRVHLHSGVEAFYAVDGEGCLQTAAKAFKLVKGGTLVIPTGETMRFIATGTRPRRDFAVIVYDSSKPPTTRFPMDKASELASCGP